MMTAQQRRRAILYPESDGQPMAENTLQFRWIVTIKEGLEAQYADDLNVFIAGDLFWYPVEGHPEIRTAPDILAVFGRPKEDRGSYLQWEEDGIAPQVVFEILSPGNRHGEMLRKFEFYERYGVEEYYIYDPDAGTLEGWLRDGDKLKQIAQMNGWISPRLRIRFQLIDGELRLYHPDESLFLTYTELAKQWEQAQERLALERKLAEQANQRAEQQRQRAEQEHQHAEQQRQRAESLAAQLRALGIDPQA
jgi:Uma2 family endonuclease